MKEIEMGEMDKELLLNAKIEAIKKREREVLTRSPNISLDAVLVVETADDDIFDLLTRWKILKNDNRDRLLRKLMEEIGEYCEAVEFENGSTHKVKKFGDANPSDMLEEEVCDIVMMALALARYEGLEIRAVLENVSKKLGIKREG
jgi:phosphoribosyl-ATP pyrophosphohydrolase